MSNSKRGTVTIEVNGTSIDMRVSTNAMVRYHDKTGESFIAGFNALQKSAQDDTSIDVPRLRTLVWAALPSGMTEEEAGDLMDEIGLVGVMSELAKATMLAFPQSEPEGNGRRGTSKAAPKKET